MLRLICCSLGKSPHSSTNSRTRLDIESSDFRAIFSAVLWLMSGLLVPHGPSARVLNAVTDGRIRLVYDSRILTEYRDVLRRPRFELAPARIAAFLDALQSQMLVIPQPVRVTGPDADDIVFVEAAMATADRTIVTGKLAHYPPESRSTEATVVIGSLEI